MLPLACPYSSISTQRLPAALSTIPIWIWLLTSVCVSLSVCLSLSLRFIPVLLNGAGQKRLEQTSTNKGRRLWKFLPPPWGVVFLESHGSPQDSDPVAQSSAPPPSHLLCWHSPFSCLTCHFLTMLPWITSQINHLHLNPCLSLCLGKNPNKDKYQLNFYFVLLELSLIQGSKHTKTPLCLT